MLNYLKSLIPYIKDPVPKTAKYEGQGPQYGQFFYNKKRPIFNRMLAQAMLADPHVKFGLYLIKGPILSGSRFLIDCDNQQVKEYLVKQITRFWTRSAKLALRSMHYGWYGAEVMYKINSEGRLQFDTLINLDPNHAQPVVLNNGLVGVQVSMTGGNLPVYLPAPKSFWTVHARESHRWYGQSRLYGAHIPWFEYNAPEGFRDSRRLFFYKNAFDGGVIRYPFGVQTFGDGTQIDNRDYANMILDRQRNGSGLAIPQSADEANNWDWQPAQSQDISQSYSEYGHDLRDEVWEGLGVPPEIAKASGTGAYAGRQIPQEAFYSLLQEIVQDLMVDFDEQVLRPMVKLNFGDSDPDYEIECFGLLRNLEEDRGNHKDDARQPLGMEGGDQTEDPYLSHRGSQQSVNQMNMNSICLTREQVNQLYAAKAIAWYAPARPRKAA